MLFTDCDDVTGDLVAKLILQELRLIRSEMKEEMQKLALYMKVCLMRQDNVEESEILEKNCDDVIQTEPDLNEPVHDFFDGSLVFGDGFALDDTEKNYYELGKCEKVSTRTAVKLDVVNYVVNSGDVVDNGVSITACRGKDDDFVKDEIGDLVKVESEQTNSVLNCTTLEPNSSFPPEHSSDSNCALKYNPCDSARSYMPSDNETFTKAGLIQLQDGEVPEYNDKKEETINDSPTTRSSTNTRFDANKKKEGRTPENADISIISKIPRKHLQLYTCQFCSKSFRSYGSIVYHLRIHTGERPYKCEVCSKRFLQNSDLKKHRIIHTGEKPYKCDVCSKQFKRKAHLKVHYRIHTGEKPYKCDLCSKRFTESSSLKAHQRSHARERLSNVRYDQNDLYKHQH